MRKKKRVIESRDFSLGGGFFFSLGSKVARKKQWKKRTKIWTMCEDDRIMMRWWLLKQKEGVRSVGFGWWLVKEKWIGWERDRKKNDLSNVFFGETRKSACPNEFAHRREEKKRLTGGAIGRLFSANNLWKRTPTPDRENDEFSSRS